MIKLEKVNKYFNRHKKNQIHVIDNTTITFPNVGLVALLGSSGSGKTTLLNVIGGLDKLNSGAIYIDGVRITKRSVRNIDKIRNLNIGYIFQDYKLVDNMTVYENVALSLKIIGIKNEEEINKRVMYTLEKVNMARYKNRPCNMLSGGERQRVGIARALVKNPKIIIADEPTGNLDSKNSLEVMNIIKSISSKYLVLLVTHEEELAKYYATRIVEVKDGKVINDYENNYEGSLDYEIENRIYLKDYKDYKNIKKDNVNIDIYRNNNEPLNIVVAFKNGNIYIKSENEEKIEVVDNNSNIEIFNKHYEEIQKENNITDFNLEEIIDKNYKPKHSSIFKLASFITYGFKKILDYPILKKILLGGFFLSGMFIFYAVASINAALTINDEDFISINKDYLTVEGSNIKVDDYLSYENLENIDYILPSNSIVNFNFNYDTYLQTKDNYGVMSGSISDIKSISSNDLSMGKMPQNDYEIVVSNMVLNKFLELDTTKMAGLFEIKDLLNHSVKLKNMDDFKIVGVIDKDEPNIYASKSMFTNIIANSISLDDYNTIEENTLIDYNLLINKIKIVNGSYPYNDYEVIVNKLYEEEMPLNKEINMKVNGHKLKVVGYYENLVNISSNYLVNNNMIKYDLISKAKNLSIYGNDKEKILKYFHDKKMNIYESYDYAKNSYMKLKHDNIIATLTVSGVILGISLIEILLMIRSSFLSRIKEVGIYRAIGIKKSDIYKMFSGEILAITCIASITGISFMCYILYCFKNISYVSNLFTVNIFTYLFSILLVLFFNLIIGLFPVYNTIRKTPAQILSRFDVD